jgi:hypothetical protein
MTAVENARVAFPVSIDPSPWRAYEIGFGVGCVGDHPRAMRSVAGYRNFGFKDFPIADAREFAVRGS